MSMKTKRFTEEQIIAILKEAEAERERVEPLECNEHFSRGNRISLNPNDITWVYLSSISLTFINSSFGDKGLAMKSYLLSSIPLSRMTSRV
jgi:hypothetical protein